MIGNNQLKNDPVIEQMNRLFPVEYLMETAKETGLVKRIRKINPVTLFWVLVLGFGVHLERTLAGLKRQYEKETAKELSSSSWYDRFTPELVTFLRQCVLRGIEIQAQQPGRILKEKLRGFKDLIIQDSSVIRLHETLSKIWPAARSKKVAAGVKVSLVVSAIVDGIHSVRLVPENTAEVKTLKIGPWVRDRILLIDLGFFKYGVFDKVDKYKGYFISRLKNNANPLIVGVNCKWRGRSVPVVGKRLKDVKPLLKRQILDVTVEVEFKKRKYRGKRSNAKRQFRLVGVYNEEDKKYHFYITNIDKDKLDGKDIALLYRARWEIELIFKELKSRYCIDLIPSAKPNIVEAFIWIGILTLLCSRRIFLMIRAANPDKSKRFTHLRWAKVFAENAPDLMRDVIRSNGLEWNIMTYVDIFSSQACDPNVNRKRLMEEWVA